MKKNLMAPLIGAAVSLSLLDGSALRAGDTETTPFPGVRYVHRHVSEPREIDMHIVLIDLNRPGVKIITTGPNVDRPGETDLETTRAFVLKEFGAVDAIAFDGGGSATMVMADGKDSEPRVLNRPSDGKERAVGNNLGVLIRPPSN